ncbi:IS66 family insertion sequence element accessory protein TnpA [Gudongella sp. DL1XJH-153]|uniref:IS66 family insertion sequence element accessory protein TnpA n=1 Tax=Gudongella sp. DL1XJH-153 TaxID=3409804 RepID=UPI003BB72199
MDMRSLDHQAKVMDWRELISECRRSGKTVKIWCDENSIPVSKYYYWLRVVRNESLVLAGNNLGTPSPQFAQVTVKDIEQSTPATNTTCAVLKSGAFSLEISNGADIKVLEHTLKILGNLC